MNDANDYIYNPDGPQVPVQDSVAATDSFPDPSNPNRVNQQKTIPDFVKNRSLGQVISSSASGLGQGLFVSAIIPDSTSGTFNLTVANNQGQVILAIPDVSVYIGTKSAATQWPTPAVGGGNLPVYVMNDYGLTNNVNVVTRVIIRNNTGSAQTIIVACRWRIITNSASTQPNQTIS